MKCAPKYLCTESETGELEHWRAKTTRNKGRCKENIINSHPIPMLFIDLCQDSCPCAAILMVFWWGCLSLPCFHQCVHCTNRRGSQRVKVLAEISICKSAETNWIVSFHLFCLWCPKSQKEIQVWQKHLIHHCLIFCWPLHLLQNRTSNWFCWGNTSEVNIVLFFFLFSLFSVPWNVLSSTYWSCCKWKFVSDAIKSPIFKVCHSKAKIHFPSSPHLMLGEKGQAQATV